MADPYQLSMDQDDLPAVLIDRSPGAPGDDVPDTLLPPPRVAAAAPHPGGAIPPHLGGATGAVASQHLFIRLCYCPSQPCTCSGCPAPT